MILKKNVFGWFYKLCLTFDDQLTITSQTDNLRIRRFSLRMTKSKFKIQSWVSLFCHEQSISEKNRTKVIIIIYKINHTNGIIEIYGLKVKLSIIVKINLQTKRISK